MGMEGTVGSRHRQRVSQDTGSPGLAVYLPPAASGLFLVPKALRTRAEVAGACVG